MAIKERRRGGGPMANGMMIRLSADFQPVVNSPTLATPKTPQPLAGETTLHPTKIQPKMPQPPRGMRWFFQGKLFDADHQLAAIFSRRGRVRHSRQNMPGQVAPVPFPSSDNRWLRWLLARLLAEHNVFHRNPWHYASRDPEDDRESFEIRLARRLFGFVPRAC